MVGERMTLRILLVFGVWLHRLLIGALSEADSPHQLSYCAGSSPIPPNLEIQTEKAGARYSRYSYPAMHWA